MIERSENSESEAVIQIENMISEYRESIKTIWHWGDGNGGCIRQMMQDFIGHNPIESSTPSYSKKKISQRIRTFVFERDEYRCVQCGTHKQLCVDHIKPEVLGGTLDYENLQTLCRSCNSKKGAASQ